jgi:hypothetical protein
MKKLEEFIDKHYRKVFFFLLIVILYNTCGNPNRVTNKRLDSLTKEVDSLKQSAVSAKDLQIEGLKSEKRMIQSVDRKLIDVNRQIEIDKELKALGK